MYVVMIAYYTRKSMKTCMSAEVEVDEDMNDNLEDMIHDIRVDSFMKARMYDTLHSDMEEPLFLGCKFFIICHLY